MEGVQDRMEALARLQGEPGWEVLKKHLTSVRDTDMISLASVERKLPEDFLRGRIYMATWFLESLPDEVSAYFKEQEKRSKAEGGQPSGSALGHPYGPDGIGQPYLEGEDSK